MCRVSLEQLNSKQRENASTFSKSDWVNRSNTIQTMSIEQLQQKYHNTNYPQEASCEDPEIHLSHDLPRLHFASAISLEKAKNFTDDLVTSDLPKVLDFWIDGPVSREDFDFFLSRATHFLYVEDWPQLASLWSEQWDYDNKSYPQVVEIKFNNLRWAFTRAQLQSLKRVLPNLATVEYVNTSCEHFEDPLLSQSDLEEVLFGVTLVPFDN